MANQALAADRAAVSPALTALVWIGAAIALLGALLVLIPGPGFRFHVWGLGTAFAMLRWGAWAGAAGAILSLVGLIALLATRTRRWRLFAVAGAVLGVIAIGVPWAWLNHAQGVPPIHDITTNTVNPPAFTAVLPLRRDASNSPVYGGAEIAAQQRAAYPDIQPIVLGVAPDKAFAAALAVARQDGWKIQAQDTAAHTIEATATTLWFGFKDDVAIRIRPQGTGSLLDIRSASRIGKSDVGKNAARIRQFRQQIKDRLSKAS